MALRTAWEGLGSTSYGLIDRLAWVAHPRNSQREGHEMAIRRSLGMLAVAGLLVLGAGGCTSNGESTLEVTLQEFAVVPAESSASAGAVTFDVTNDGPDDPHELVVIKSDLAPDALPTDDNGAVDESGEGIEVIGEIEEFPPGQSRSKSFNLDAGAYVLICNVFEEAEQESHYQNGMRTAFTVED
jgi:hypothetical protein